jgi:hypothetical protein
MPRQKKYEVAVVVAESDPVELLTIRSFPTEAEVKKFVKEHNRRFQKGESAGPSGSEAVEVTAAFYCATETDLHDKENWIGIDLSSVLVQNTKVQED